MASIPQNDFPVINQFVTLLKLSSVDLNSSEVLKTRAEEICEELALTVVKRVHYAFTPHGITLVYVLSQSHLVLHSWPEYQTLHVDLVSCSESTDEDKVKRVLSQVFLKDSITYFEFKKINLHT